MNMPDVTCRSLTLVDDKGNPKLFLFLDQQTGDPGIVMHGNHGRLHMLLGNDGVTVVMADGPGNAKVIIKADETRGQFNIVGDETPLNCKTTGHIDSEEVDRRIAEKAEELMHNYMAASRGL